MGKCKTRFDVKLKTAVRKNKALLLGKFMPNTNHLKRYNLPVFAGISSLTRFIQLSSKAFTK